MTNELVIDAFERIKQIVHESVEGLTEDDLLYRPSKSANSIAWLVWHLTRVQDDHVADLAGREQVWTQGWYDRFNLPFKKEATGYGQTSEEVASLQASSELLLGYYDAVHAATIKYVSSLPEAHYRMIVDKHWNPPVTLAVRLVSIISDDLQHAGQAAYVRGLLN
jgi:hypothetical protein